MQRSVRYALFLVAGFPALLGAQGFGLYEQGTCAMGRAGTGVAAPCADGSAIFFNPAGLAGLKGGRATIGVTLLDVQGGFTDDFQQKTKLDDPLLAIPQIYVAYGVTPKLGVGIGLFAPYGLETRWPFSFDGRFAGYKNVLRSVYVQPTVAYQVTPWLSLGAGFDIVAGSVELNQRLDLAEAPVDPALGVPPGTVFGQFGIAPGTDFADAHLEATKTTVTAHWGGIIKVNDKLSIGGRYLMHAKFDYSGTARFTQVNTNLVLPATITVGALTLPAGTPIDLLLSAPPPNGLYLFNTLLTTQAVSTTITNPEQVIFGLAYKPRTDWTLFGDYQFTRWGKRFYTLEIDFANAQLNRVLHEAYQNTNGFRVAAEWAKDAKWTFRGGYLYHDGAAPAETVTPLLPEGDRNEFTGGFTVKLARGLTGDFAYQYIKQNDRRGRTREPLFNQAPTTGMNDGVYNFHAHLFGVSLGYAF
jgi:long-chain fatty acid transport protein